MWTSVFASAGQGRGAGPDLLGAWVTLALSLAVATGYAAIAFNWYFQRMVASPAARAALRRLLWISLACAACGGAFHVADVGWGHFRLCDAGVALLAAYTWSFAARMRGLSLVDARLAQVAELEARADRYREIAELLPHLVWTATADGRVDYSNRRWVEYAGGGHAWTEAVHEADRARVAGWWREAVERGRGGAVEARLCGAGGACRTFLVSATPIAHGDAVKWLGACADIEAQKQLAAEKERQARQKSFFLNALSHDLRSPLNVVTLHADLLRNGATGEEVAESARTIAENAAAAAELISRLLDFAKVGSVERNVVDRVSLAETLRHVQRRYLPLADQKGLYLRLSHEVADAELATDAHKLERIVSNLVENAIKYTRHGGVTLSAVRLPSDDGDGAVSIRVSDTGIGIPGDEADNLFDEFYQLGNDERDRRKGFGLGLAICRSLAEQIGGTVRLVSTGAGGSCFELRIGGRVAKEEGVSGADADGRALCGV